MFKRLIRREDGVTMVLALAFMAISVPIVTAALGLASTLTVDSTVKSQIAQDQFSQIGANELAIQMLEDPDDPDYLDALWDDDDGDGDPDGDEFIVTLNDEEFIVNIDPSGASPLPPDESEGLVVTKNVFPNTGPENSQTPTTFTYDILVENLGEDTEEVTKIYDGLPPGFDYVQGTALLNFEPFDDPSVDVIQFEEENPDLGKSLLTWDMSAAGTTLEVDESLTLSFDVEAVDLDEGNYCNQAWIEPEGSQTRTGKTAKVTVGNPADNSCTGEFVEISGDVAWEANPDEDPEDPNDDYQITYTIVIDNTGPVDLHLWWLRDKLPPGFTYKMWSTTGDITSKNPFPRWTFNGRQRLNWFFLFPTKEIPAGESRTVIFQALAPAVSGAYYNEVWAFFAEYDEDDATYSWPSSLVVLADTYQVTIDGEPSSQVWIVDGDSEVLRWEIGRR